MLNRSLLSIFAATLAVGSANAEPLSGTFTGIVMYAAQPNLVGTSATGTFSINPMGCTLGTSPSAIGLGACDSSRGVQLTLTVGSMVDSVSSSPATPSSVADSFVALSATDNSLTAEVENVLAMPVGDPRNFAYITLDGAPGVFGTGQDYNSLQPGVTTGGTVYYAAPSYYVNVALSSVTFDQSSIPVPEPASGIMVLGGIGLLLALSASTRARLRPRSRHADAKSV